MRIAFLRVLIVARSCDGHVAPVQWALLEQGIEPTVWVPEAFPLKTPLSWRAIDSRVCVGGVGEHAGFVEWDFETVWLRRIGKPDLQGAVSEADREYAEAEVTSFVHSILSSYEGEGRWVNSLSAKTYAQHKPRQIRHAIAAGLRVPRTLITADRDEIASFLSMVEGSVIAKQFWPVAWKSADGFAQVRTVQFGSDNLKSWRHRELCPTIFQERILKKFEVRLTVLGRSVVGARLDVVGRGAGEVDWRLARVEGQSLEISAWEVPADVAALVCKLMENLGLAFGCIDGIIDEDGEFTFLEVNEMGQFLWLDEACPELTLLQRFCSFLMTGSDADASKFGSFKDFVDSGFRDSYIDSHLDLYGEPRLVRCAYE